jgi:hypothetical protein
MQKPDRIERAVEKTREGYISKFIAPEVAVQLLRREAAYQRAQVRGIIKTQRKQTAAPYDQDYLHGYQQACDDILAALKGQL